jgi:hypothetical protein
MAVSFSLWAGQRGLAPERSEVPVPFIWPRVTRLAFGNGDTHLAGTLRASPHFRVWPRVTRLAFGNGDRHLAGTLGASPHFRRSTENDSAVGR